MAKEIEEKTAQRQADAPYTPFLATVTDAVLLGADGAAIYECAGPTASSDILGAIGHYMDQETQPASLIGGSPSLYCFDARNVLRIAATAAAQIAVQRTKPLSYWLRSSLTPVPWADPCDLFINSALHHDIGLGGLCRFLGIPRINDAFPAGARERAELARHIVLRSQL